eukprot:11997348-Ditylum_brightwellii.AAC.1
MEGRTRALHKCWKIYASDVDLHPEIKKEQLKLWLIELLTERNGGDSNIQLRTVTALAHGIGEPNTTSLSMGALHIEWR